MYREDVRGAVKLHRLGSAGRLLWAMALIWFGTACLVHAENVVRPPAQADTPSPYAYRCFALAEASSGPEYLFGVINDVRDPRHYYDEWARGVRATTLELHWKLYEPQQGAYNTAYIAQVQKTMRNLKHQGWYVQLVPGYHYVPDWVFDNYPSMYYVNQYGESYDPDPITLGDYRVINAPYNPQARALIAGYIQRIFLDFDQSDPSLRFDSVRVGGGVQGEVRYPPRQWNGHANAYWAFDAYAQDPTNSGIPSSVVGWRPGIDTNPGSAGRGQLIVNPGFEDTRAGYPVLGWSPDDEVSAELSSKAPHNGSHALAVTISTPNRVHQYVRAEPNTTYRVGGWVKSGDGVGRARVFLIQYDANTAEVPDAPFVKLESNAADWTEQTGSLTTSATTRYLKVGLDGDQAGTHYFDDLWLQREGETDDRDRNIDVPAAFYDWYVQSLTDYQNWQITEMRRYFDGQLDIMYSGKGARINQVNDALTNDLRGDGWSEASSALYAASLYERHTAELSTTRDVALYMTGIDVESESQVNDSSPYPRDWSAARWIAFLARSHGMPVWGENSGQDDAAKMALTAKRMHANGFLGLLWGFESELYADPNLLGFASIDDYEEIIARYSSLRMLFLPFTVRLHGDRGQFTPD